MGVRLCLCETVSATGPIVHPSGDTRMNMEQWRNNTDRRKQKDSEKKLSQCHLVRHKYYWTALGTNPHLWDEKPTTNRLSYGRAVNIGLTFKVDFIQM
jgi:hypothetical protein